MGPGAIVADNSMYIVSSQLQSKMDRLDIQTPSFTCKGCEMALNSLRLVSRAILIDNQSNLQFKKDFIVNSTGIHLSGTMQIEGATQLFIKEALQLSGTSLVTDSVYIRSYVVAVSQGAQIISKKTNCTLQTASPPDCNSPRSSQDAMQAGIYTYVEAQDLIVDPGASITSSTILVCAFRVSVSGTMTANSRGCVAALGAGAGSQVTGGAGSGGGHGGIGGASNFEGTGSQGGPTYDDVMFPGMSGSGGGSSLLGGVGGGVIVIRAKWQMFHQGLIDVNGGSGTGITGQGGGGGGSGGTVYIQARSLSGSGDFQANGGSGGEPGGGGGGGGVIHFDWVWKGREAGREKERKREEEIETDSVEG
eukprot:TRINITY_DN1052_c1_g1_i3.p1 TRINITY_DN1052_c1_g1~~TRINITY_DN1052_c1_g1_i3.p1  ORF type:complete len:363 (-),score=92.82 TRINITY_DN1052_c1_g1_i3:398-1486(-)